MTRFLGTLSAAGVCVGLLAVGCTATGAASAGGAGWGAARQISVVAGQANVALSGRSFACTSPADCTLVYGVWPGRKVFAVSEAHGDWGRPRAFAVQAPGSYACTEPGECVSAGNSLRTDRAIVVSQVHGVWGSPQDVPGLAALDVGGYDGLSALSCSKSGWCAAAGFYVTGQHSPSHGQYRPFVVSQRGGTWLTALPRPHLPGLSADWSARISALSCDPDGACTAGGSYSTPSRQLQPFVVSERGGLWGPGRAITGVTAPDQDSAISAISCTTPGNCTAAGSYTSSPDRVFVVSEQDGRWGRARSLSGAAALGSKLGKVEITGLSCAAPGQCAMAGDYTSAGEYKYSVRPTVSFIASQVNGRWSPAHSVPGLAGLHAGAAVVINSISCGAPGDCVGGGFYTIPGSEHAFLVTQTNGHWGGAAPVPGLANLTSNSSAVGIVRCWSATRCIALGDYYMATGSTDAHLFAATRR